MPLGTQNTFSVISALVSLGAMREPPPGGGWLVLPGLLGGHRLVLLGLPSSLNKPMRCGGLIGAHTQLAHPPSSAHHVGSGDMLQHLVHIR
jgi:hypothetical protein